MMMKRPLQIIFLVTLLILMLVYSWNLFHKISHNRLVFVTSVDDYIPSNVKTIINFNRNYNLDLYFELDTTNIYLLDPIKDNITYPLVVNKFEKGDDLLLMRATREQEAIIKKVFYEDIALFHTPKIKRVGEAELLFYSLPQNEFITICFYKGIVAISKDYIKVEQLVATDRTTSHLLNTSDYQINYDIQRIRDNASASLFTQWDSTIFALSYHKGDSLLFLEGEYFGKLEDDSLKISYNEINSLLNLNMHYTDSVSWNEKNKIQIWLNNVEE